MKTKSSYNYVADYLFEVRSKGRYSVTLEELRNKFNVSEKALHQNIYRLKNKKQIAQIRKEFYVIIPPQYSNIGMVPAVLFIDDMMKFLDRDYYVGLFSAAALHGAAHQQPMEFYVITKKPALRNIKKPKLQIRFFTKGDWKEDMITERKTEAGYLRISTPELTAFDLVHYNKNIGGLNRIVPILEDLTEEIKPSALSKTALNQRTPDTQRLGYLLNKLEKNNLSKSLYGTINKKKLKEVLLSPAHKNRQGKIDEKWKTIVNTEIDI